jgi:hypothetical protein
MKPALRAVSAAAISNTRKEMFPGNLVIRRRRAGEGTARVAATNRFRTVALMLGALAMRPHSEGLLPGGDCLATLGYARAGNRD